jgi:hypothetical protein
MSTLGTSILNKKYDLCDCGLQCTKIGKADLISSKSVPGFKNNPVNCSKL